MKNISIWFNRYGVDECYGEIKGEFNKEVLNELGKSISWLGGWSEDMWDEMYEEEKGEGWVMKGFDGFGVFVVDEGYDVEKCKLEYDDKFWGK